jgi:hypothetical protein
MKKFLKIMALSILSMSMFVACNSTASSSSSVEQPVSSSVDDSKYYSVPENWSNSTLYCSVSGALIDVAVGKQLITGNNYTMAYSVYNITSDYTVATSSNEEVFTLTQSTNTDGSLIQGSYTINAIHAGDAYITIEDSNGLIRLRQKVSVRDAMTLDEINEFLPNVESWVSAYGWGDTFTLTFLYDQQVIIQGSISGSALSYTATYALSNENEEEFQFKFTDDTSTTYSLSGFNISKTGDFMYLQDSWGTASILFANDSPLLD